MLSAPDPNTKGPPSRFNTKTLKILVFLFIMGVWELFGRLVSDVLLAPPTRIIVAFCELTLNGEVPYAIFVSLQSFFVGFFLAVILGVTIGIGMGLSKSLSFTLEGFINGLYSTPLVALIPLVMLWLGMGFKGKVFFIMLVGIFPIIINTIAGARNIDATLLEVGRSFKASKWHIFTELIIPFSLPFILTGIRLGMGRAVVGMVLAEMYLAFEGGIGHLIMAYGSSLSTPPLFAVIIVLPFFGIGVSKLVRYLEVKITPWNEERSDL